MVQATSGPTACAAVNGPELGWVLMVASHKNISLDRILILTNFYHLTFLLKINII